MSSELLKKLQQGDVEGFNMTRSERTRPNLFAAELAELVLAGADLSGANLEKADLTDSDLTSANLIKANCAGIDGSNLNLTGAYALRSKFRDAWMDGVRLSGADLSQADFADANIESAKAAAVVLTGARLRGCNAKNGDFTDADFCESRLHQADFSGSDLSRADFTAAVANETIFTNCKLDNSIAPEAQFNSSNFEGASITSARWNGVQLSSAKLNNASLVAADLTRANLEEADLTGADLSDCTLIECSLHGAILTDTILKGADLSGVDAMSLGLTEEQIASLCAWGFPNDMSAPALFDEPKVAINNGAVGLIWKNMDGPELLSYRVAIRNGDEFIQKSLPVAVDTVKDAQIIARNEGFAVVITRQTPSGLALFVWDIDLKGELVARSRCALGYEPVANAILSEKGGTLRMAGLARRGPTLAIHVEGEEGLVPKHSARVPTALGFLGGLPLLSCKGGVVMPLTATGAAAPRSRPEAFGGPGSLAIAIGDFIVAVSTRAGKNRTSPRQLVVAWVPKRGVPEELMLAEIYDLVGPVIVNSEIPTLYWADDGVLWSFDLTDPGGVRKAVLPVSDDITLTLGSKSLAVVDDGKLTVLGGDGTVYSNFG